MKRRAAHLFLLLVLHAGLSACTKLSNDDDKKEERWNLAALLLIAYYSEPCNFAGTPSATTAGFSSTNVLLGSVKGRVLLTTGDPVVNALVVVDDAVEADSTYWGSHTSINRDGSFLIAGIPLGTGMRLGIEPVSSTFAERIDTHIDCFMSPASFTSGWYVSGGTAAGASQRSSGSTFAVVGGSVTDLGTISVAP